MIALFAAEDLLRLLVPSTLGLVVFSMPILAPLLDFAGVQRHLALTAFQTLIGMANLVTPACMVVVRRAVGDKPGALPALYAMRLVWRGWVFDPAIL